MTPTASRYLTTGSARVGAQEYTSQLSANVSELADSNECTLEKDKRRGLQSSKLSLLKDLRVGPCGSHSNPLGDSVEVLLHWDVGDQDAELSKSVEAGDQVHGLHGDKHKA